VTASLHLPDAAAALELLLRATLLIGAAWISAAALRAAGASAAARHLAWLLGIAALLVLPILWWVGPALRLPILPAEAANAAAAAAAPVTAPSPAGPAGPLSPESPAYWSWGVLLLVAYGLGAFALLLRLVVGRWVLARLWRDADAVQDGAWESLLARLASEMGVSRRVALRIARRPVMPMTWGTRAPKLLLPAEACRWSPERRRLVLLHELAHVARRDSLSRSLASLACALYWFHPGAWLAARQLRIEQEHAADDRVLTAGGSAQAYARSLLHLARGAGERLRPDLAATMAGMCQLERRLVSITRPARRDRPGRFFLSSSAAFAAFATLVVAAGVPVSPSSAVPTPISARQLAAAAPADARPAGDPRASAEKGSAMPAGAARAGAESNVAPKPSPRTGGSEDDAGVRAGPSEAGISHEGAPQSAGEGQQAPAAALALRDYGWQLPQREMSLLPGSPAASPRTARLTVPAPLSTASSERTARSRWTQIVPHILLTSTPTGTRPPAGSPPSTGRATPMLSWSIEMGPPR